MLDDVAIAAAMIQAVVCPVPSPVPPALAGWTKPHSVTADALQVGAASTVALVPSARFAIAPERAPPAGSTGAVLNVTIRQPGRYRVALGAAAWIDLAAAGKRIAPVAHGHGPACSGVRKMVDFELPAGAYSLQLSGATVSSMTAMVAALR